MNQGTRQVCDCGNKATIRSQIDGCLICQQCNIKEQQRKGQDRKRTEGSPHFRGLEPYHVVLVGW